MNKVSFSLADQDHYQINWDIAFPADHQSVVVLFVSDTNLSFGVVVRRFSEHEARFVIRGDPTSDLDLYYCLREAENTALSLGCRTLLTQEKIEINWLNSLELFLKCSFNSINETASFEGPFNLFAERILKAESVLLQKRLLPKGARITCLAEGQQQARALLHNTLMMDDFEFDNRIKSNASSPLSPSFSQLAWNHNDIVGILLVARTTTAELFHIPIRYVIPSFRHTWVNTFLLAASVRLGIQENAKSLRFEANLVAHQETLSLAKKMGCKMTKKFSRFEKRLT